MEGMHSLSHLMFNQVEQIADVKTCNIDNVEQRYYKVQWKCTWEPAIVLERFCGKIIAEYEKGPSSCRTQAEKSVDMIENHEETEQFEDTCNLFSSSNSFKELQLQRDKTEDHVEPSLNCVNKEAVEISSTNEVQNVINKLLPPTNNKLNNKLNLDNFDIKPDPDDEIFQNINILNENSNASFNHAITIDESSFNRAITAEESSSTNNEQNNGLSVSFDPCNNFSSNIMLKSPTKASSNTRRDPRNKLTRNNFKCHLCSYCFPEKSQLNRHMRKHTSEKPFKCRLCSYSASQKSHIKIHMGKHTGDFLFKCDWCPYSTNVHTSLKRHLMTHTGQKPFKCDRSNCEYAAITKANLIKHLQVHHQQGK